MRTRQIAPGTSSCLPNLRLNVDSLAGIHPTTDQKYITIRQGGTSRIPATVVHVRQPDPGAVKWAIYVGAGQSHPVANMSANNQQAPIRQEGMPRTEDVCSRLTSRSDNISGWIPQ